MGSKSIFGELRMGYSSIQIRSHAWQLLLVYSLCKRNQGYKGHHVFQSSVICLEGLCVFHSVETHAIISIDNIYLSTLLLTFCNNFGKQNEIASSGAFIDKIHAAHLQSYSLMPHILFYAHNRTISAMITTILHHLPSIINFTFDSDTFPTLLRPQLNWLWDE